MAVPITVFTPTYNRGYILGKAYESLCNQSCKDFEWVIVDDGSTDDTESLVAGFIAENKVNIRYKKVGNEGKHLAINHGVEMAKGEWFIILDSDDRLTPDAVEWIINKGKEVADDNEFAGISGIRITPDGTKIGGGADFGVIDATATAIRSRFHIKGDLAEVFKTNLLQRYPFPKFEDEKFCPEALVWNRIAKNGYKLRYIHKGIYLCEYLPDGLTAKMTKIRRESPRASMTYYAEAFHQSDTLKDKIRNGINFWRFAFAPYNKCYGMMNPLALILWLVGMAIRVTDKRALK